MSWKTLAVVAALCLVSRVLGGVFDIGTKPAEWAVVSTEESLPEGKATSPMLDQIKGVLARLDKPQLLDLRATAAGTGSPMDAPEDAARLCIVHLGAGAQVRRVEILRGADGTYFAQELLTGDARPPEGAKVKPRAVRLNQPKFARLAAAWPAYRSQFVLPQGTPAAGQAGDLAKPITPGWFTIDKDLLGERFNGGEPTGLEVPARDLASESFLVRLPKDYDPKNACGVVVYVDPGSQASIYPEFNAAADELGLIFVAAVKTGNDVHRALRYQQALDGLATVSERFLIDPRRVYVAGISGGGQIATHLWLCFPDVFTGAVPIVALGSYENIPAGPEKVWPATFRKPENKLFRLALPHRCAAMTGGQDMNEEPVKGAAKSLMHDGLQVKVFDYPDMAHGVPTAARFTEALKWVDEPYAKKREKEVQDAAAALAKVEGDASLPADVRAKMLIEVTRVGPWTPSAWRAIELLDKK